uniref:Uncharacterized protein n=1 Tax=Brassica campestris TaxID=3711 RepID=A0A3P5ZQ30_BRACM|nr:unnamed protein product [Brassica rapa]
MYDVMLDEAKLWLDEWKVESSSPPAPPVKEDSGYDYYYSSADDEMDPVEKAKYLQQVRDSDGFDVDFFYHPFAVTILTRGQIYNSGVQQQFTCCFWDSSTKNKERLRLITKQCRIKPQVPAAGKKRYRSRTLPMAMGPDAVDEFYTGKMPNWLQDDDDALIGVNKLQFHVVKDSELQDNEWLNLYAEIALSSERPDMETYLPLEVKKVVVRTKEDVEPSMKLKSSNAIFYTIFKTHRGHECKAIIRQTMDGIQGHMCLEVTCMLGK